MKYYYKTPEQVQREIREYIEQNKTIPNKKTLIFLFLNILILVIVILVLDKSGILYKTFHHKNIESISYRIDGNVLRIRFDVHKPIILTSSNTKEDYILHLQKVILQTIDQNKLEFSPVIIKTIIDQENPFLDIQLPESISANSIQFVYLVLNNKTIEAKKY